MIPVEWRPYYGDDPESRLRAAGYSQLPQSEMWIAPSGGFISTEEAPRRLEADGEEAKEA